MISWDFDSSRENNFLKQNLITLKSIEALKDLEPRRFKLSMFDEPPLKPPLTLGSWQRDWNLIFPFKETYVPAFEEMCDINHVPFLSKEDKPARFTFLPDVTDKEIEEVETFIEKISKYVAIRDCLALSFALDYDKEEGNPKNERTFIGQLRYEAKPYNADPTPKTFLAANKLIRRCARFLSEMTCFDSADAIVAIPKNIGKTFDLPTYLAEGIAKKVELKNLSSSIKTIKKRPEMKNLDIDSKLKELKGTIETDSKVFKNKVVLLIDDLYESGVTMNYVGKILLDVGARKIFGLACDKTLRNSDNIGGKK